MTETPPRGRQRPARPGFNPPKVQIRPQLPRPPAPVPVAPKLNLPPPPPIRRRAPTSPPGETPTQAQRPGAQEDDATPLASGGDVKLNRSGWKMGGKPPC